MKRLVCLAAILLATPAFAQQAAPPPDYAVKLSAAKWNVILMALGERPAKEVFDTVVDIKEQIAATQSAKEPQK